MKKIRMLYFKFFKPRIYWDLKHGEAVLKGIIDGINSVHE